MKLYKVAAAPPGERWSGSKTGLKDFAEIELPKDGRQGMAAFLNGNEREVGLEAFGQGARLDADVQELDELQQAELRAVAAVQKKSLQLTADAIVAFILDDATVAQAEAVFAALGTRFKEQVNGTR